MFATAVPISLSSETGSCIQRRCRYLVVGNSLIFEKAFVAVALAKLLEARPLFL